MLAWPDLTGCAFSLRPLHWFQYTSCPNFSQCNVTSKVLQFCGIICLDNSCANCNDHLLEITPAVIRTPATTSFTFTRNLSSKRFGLPFLLCMVALSFFFVFFNFGLPFIYWYSYKSLFRIFFPKFLQCRFCSMFQSVFTNDILNAFWNWGVIILSRLSVWFSSGYYWCIFLLD